MSRRKGRILAFQTLYSWDVASVPVEDLFSFSWIESDDPTKEVVKDETICNFAKLIVTGTLEHLEEIDKLIESHLATNWSMDRINKVALAVMRLSVYSLLYQKDIHASIVIDEAVSIAKEYGAEDSFKFINAVLDKINKDISK